MMDMVIEYWDASALVEYARNPRKNDHVVDALVSMIREFGFRVPILARSNGLVVDGHLRLKAARKLGMSRVPVVCADDLTDIQVKAFRLAVNRMAELADWDSELLALELEDLNAADFDLSVLGFEADFVAELLDTDDPELGAVDPDEVPAVQAEPVSRTGDLWVLGDHRLLVGDSTRVDDLERLMDGEKADMWLTDPPYNVAYQGGTSAKMTIANDDMDDASFRQFLRDAYSAADAVMRPGAVFYIWHADSEGFNFRGACLDVGWQVRQCLIWVKNALVLGRQDYHWRHEPCLYGWKDGASHAWHGGRKQTTVSEAGDWAPFREVSPGVFQVEVEGRLFIVEGSAVIREILPSVMEADKPTKSDLHPTTKPVELFEKQMRNNTRREWLVLDSFGGSGTTLIAAERHGRRARLMELDPVYADVIVRRWEKYTGRSAVLEGSDKTFAALAADRVMH